MNAVKPPWVMTGRYIGVANHKTAIGELKSASGCWSEDDYTRANGALMTRAVNLLEAHEAVAKIALHFLECGYKCEDGDELSLALAQLAKLKEGL